MIKYLKKEEVLDDVLDAGVVMVDFFATWCPPCKMLTKELEEMDDAVNIIKVDVDECGDLARKYGIMSVPTIVYFKDKKQVDSTVGYISKEELLEKIKAL